MMTITITKHRKKELVVKQVESIRQVRPLIEQLETQIANSNESSQAVSERSYADRTNREQEASI